MLVCLASRAIAQTFMVTVNPSLTKPVARQVLKEGKVAAGKGEERGKTCFNALTVQ